MKVSIIVPTFCPSMERFVVVKRSFAEIHRTGIPREDYELIVVSNGGEQASLIREADPDLVIWNSHNVGQAIALNMGVEASRAEILAIMDDDLSYREGWLAHGLEILGTYSKNVVSLRDFGDRYDTGVTPEGLRISRKVGGCWIVRKKIIREIGRFSNVHAFGGIYTRGLLRAGISFIVSQETYITHLGEGISLGGMKYE